MFPYTQLTDGVVTIRPFEFGDDYDLHTAVQESLPELSPWMSWATPQYTREVAKNFVIITRAEWSRGALYSFAIADAHTHEFLGGCGLSHIHPIYKFCNLGYWIRTPQHGHGFAGRAAKLAARYAFEHVNLIRAEIVIAAGNLASKRVAEKIGAHYEGILHNRMTVGTHIHDAHMFSLLPSDFGLVAKL